MEPGEPIGIVCESCGSTCGPDSGVISCDCTKAPVDVLHISGTLPDEWLVLEAQVAPETTA